MTMEASVSGEDFHSIMTASSDGATNEYIMVGSVGYAREYVPDNPAYDNVWQLADYSLWDIDNYLSDLGDTPICPSLTGVTQSGEELLNGEMTTRYTSGEGPEAFDNLDYDPSLFSDTYVMDVSSHEYWVNGEGQLVRYDILSTCS